MATGKMMLKASPVLIQPIQEIQDPSTIRGTNRFMTLLAPYQIQELDAMIKR